MRRRRIFCKEGKSKIILDPGLKIGAVRNHRSTIINQLNTNEYETDYKNSSYRVNGCNLL